MNQPHWWRQSTDQPGLSKHELCAQWLRRVLPAGHGRSGMDRGVAGKELLTCINLLLAQDWVPAQLAQVGITAADVTVARLTARRDSITEPGAVAAAATVIADYGWKVAKVTTSVGLAAIDCARKRVTFDKATRDLLKNRATRWARTLLTADGTFADPQRLVQLDQLYALASPAWNQLLEQVTNNLLETELRTRAEPAPDARDDPLPAAPESLATDEPAAKNEPAPPLAEAVPRRATEEEQDELLRTPEGRAMFDRVADAAARLLGRREAEDVLTDAIIEATLYLLKETDPTDPPGPQEITGLLQRIIHRRLTDTTCSESSRCNREKLWAEQQAASATRRNLHQKQRALLRQMIAAAMADLHQDPSWEAARAQYLIGQIDPEAPDIDMRNWRQWLRDEWGPAHSRPPQARCRSRTAAIDHTIELIRAALTRHGLQDKREQEE